MPWRNAQDLIRQKIKVGTDLNTADSTFRRVLQANVPIHSSSYGYLGELGFKVSIGRSKYSVVQVPWEMLRECYEISTKPSGYTGSEFRRLYPKQAQHHPCHIHVVGRILEVAGPATLRGEAYYAIE